MNDICDHIALNLGIDPNILLQIINRAKFRIKIFYIPKRNGSKRKIFHPDKKTKLIQYWLIHNILSRFPIHKSATAYKKKASTLENAIQHKCNRYFIRIDLQSFFPSIKFIDFENFIYHKNGLNYIDSNSFDVKNLLKLINNICFLQDQTLPIGFPSSPTISNILMHEIDSIISSNIKNIEHFGSGVYTRYADDIVFSTNKKNACNFFYEYFNNLLNETLSPKLYINKDKTLFTSTSGGSTIVTGIKICHDKHITLHKKYKDHIRLMLSLYAKNKLDKNEHQSLVGHLAYLKNIDGNFYTKLSLKYFNEINKLHEGIHRANTEKL